MVKKIYITENQYNRLVENNKTNEIDQYVEEYNEWNNQGGNNSGYKDPTENSVFEFFQNNHEDYCHDKQLIKKVLQKLKKSQIKESTNGNKIIAYHGSNHVIKNFTNEFVSGARSIDSDGPGIYFTDDKEYAELWGNYIYTVELSPNILISNINTKGLNKNVILKLIKMYPDWEANAYDWDENLNMGLQKSINSIISNENGQDIILELYHTYYNGIPKQFLTNLSNVGIDGLFIKRPEGPSHIIVYNPSIVEIKNVERLNINEDITYKGEHEAPSKEGGDSPMYDLSGTYPDDIYTMNDASKHYGDGENQNDDNFAINLVRATKNKPNYQIKIYRAIPDFNKETTNQIKILAYLIQYHDKFGFYPRKNEIIYDLQDKYDIDKVGGYDNREKLIYDDILKQIEELNKNKQNFKINNGDWVTISLNYAKEHGKSNLKNNYKILSKTTTAKHLFTDGNSLLEWGYNE